MTGSATAAEPALRIGRDRFDAVIFDLDGVITSTQRVHAAAWKATFDPLLERWSAEQGTPQAPFDSDADYRAYVDGKPRYDGVRSFLEARGIALPEGSPADPPERETVCGLGNRKNAAFNAALAERGVEVYASSVALLRALRAAGFRTAIVSSSRNCVAILEAAHLRDQFDAKVDGSDGERLGLAGKPAPDYFVEAAAQLGVSPARTVVVEDAISGVQAGRAGGFGHVLGVDRTGHPEPLRTGGADTVVSDLAEVAAAAP